MKNHGQARIFSNSHDPPEVPGSFGGLVRLRWLEMQAQRYEWADLRWLIAGHASVMSLGILGGVLGFSNALSKCA